MDLLIENNGLESLYAFLFLFWLVYLYFVKDYGHWEEMRVTHVPAIFPLGSLPRLVLGNWTWSEAFTNIYKQFPRDCYVGFFYVTEPCLLIRDPSLIKCVLETDFEYFTDRVIVTVNPKDYMANNMYNMGGSEWKRMKAKLTPAYTAAKMEMMFYLVKSGSKTLIQAIDRLPGDIKEVDTKDLLSRYIIDIIATSAFGNDIKSMENKNCEFYKFVNRMCFSFTRSMLLKIIALKSFPMFTKYHIFDFFDLEVKTFFSTAIINAIEYREKNSIDRCDFLGLMMKLRQNQSILEEGEPAQPGGPSYTNEGLTVEEITAEMHLFMLMGHESTSDTCLFCLYEVACHRKIQERLFAEVEVVLARHVDLTYKALKDMTYMDQVINEVMRLYPVFPVIMRNCTKTYKVPDSTLVIKKGMGVYISVNGPHRDPKYFPNPDIFDPERFSQDSYRKLEPFVFLPFGAGPRTCMGFRFGMMMVKSALASIVSRYVVDLTPGTQVPLVLKKSAFHTSPGSPLKLRLTPRLMT